MPQAAGANQQYLIALGCNMRHPEYGLPRSVLRQAIIELRKREVRIDAVSQLFESEPVGPSSRDYANACALVTTIHEPGDFLKLLQGLELSFGRIRRGSVWRARVLDLDIVLWNGGRFLSQNLAIPHPLFRERNFVLHPAAQIAPGWRDPVTGLTLRQLHTRLTRPRALPR